MLKSIIESLLFVAGVPLSLKRLSVLTEKSEEEVLVALTAFDNDLKNQERGLRLFQNNSEIQLVSAPEHAQWVKKMIESEFREELGKASYETLAIISFKGPITKAGLDDIRGVNSGYILRHLLIRGLIERKPNSEDARSYIYSPSLDFWKILGISSREEFPDYEKIMSEYKERFNG
ncbi:MAG: SMC-Scp complex subunit ScpB [Parcubacteria group bacterium]|nr:SMC-Scp complex subunit ScpB [Parcubacteria group bacterium]